MSVQKIHKQSFMCVCKCVYVCASVFTLAGDHVLCQLIALVTLAQEGTNEIVAVVLTGTLHITLIHIWKKADV